MAILGKISVILELLTSSFFKGWDEAKGKTREGAREIKTQMREANNASELLGRTFGVALPREVRKWVASMAPVRQALSAALPVALVAGFGVAVAAAAVKALDFFEQMRTGSADLDRLGKALGNTTAQFDKFTTSQLGALRARLLAGQQTAKERLDEIAQRGSLLGGPTFISGPDFLIDPRFAKAQEHFLEISRQIDQVNQLLGSRDKQSIDAANKSREEYNKTLEQTAKKADEAKRAFERWSESFLFGLAAFRETGGAVADLGRKQLEQINQQRMAELLRNPPELPGFDPKMLAEAGEALDRILGGLERVPQLAKPLAQVVQDLRNGFQQWSEVGLSAIGDAVLGLTSWRSVARQILSDLGRMLWYLLVVKPLMGALFGGGGGLAGAIGINSGGPTSFLSGLPISAPAGSGTFLSGGGRAHGGPVLPQRQYLVGEKGPERLTMFDRGGVVTPLGGGGKSGGGDVIIDARGADVGTVTKLAALINGRAFKEFIEQQRDAALRTA